MGTIRSVAGWAIVTAFAAGGCSTPAKETDAAGSEITTRRNNSKTEQSYVAEEPSSAAVVVLSADAEVPEAIGTSNDSANVFEDAGAPASSAGEGSSPPLRADAGGAATTTVADTFSFGFDTETAPATDAGETPVETTCHETAGLCDPVGDCARSDCDFENTGKSCTYTPDRTYPFMCVVNADYEPYRPCDTDDACAPGSVCISKVALLKDGSFYRRPGAVCRETCRQDADCGDGEWCAQATDENNEVVPDLRVCHRHCSTESDCYVGEGDEEVRCSNSVEGAPPSTFECSRYRPPAEAEPAAETTEGVAQSGEASLDTGASQASALALRSYRAQAAAKECVFNEDCPAADDCVSNTCRSRCESDAECGGAECVVVNGRGICGAPCEKPEGAACGVLPSNCGCATGETCQLNGDFEPTCAAPGRSGALDWCNASDDCDTGLSCIGGLCRLLCDPDAHPCDTADGECLLSVSREGGDVYACAGSCDPVTTPDCGAGAVCMPGFDHDRHHQALCVAERAAQRPKDSGEACKADYDCAASLGCTEAGTCQPWCREQADCADGSGCKFDASIMGTALARFGVSVDDAIGLCQPFSP